MFKGKAIYNPKGAAQEYSEWACNFFTGCSNRCTYCYLKKGIGAKVLGGCKPELKKCFDSEQHALEIFIKEAKLNEFELQKHGLFLSFTTDPCLPETINLTSKVIDYCNWAFGPKIPVKILTKSVEWVGRFTNRIKSLGSIDHPELVAFGVTLTGHDELEPGASSNQDRIEAMKKLHDAGFKTFASIEPIIYFESSLEMIRQTVGYSDLYKVGLESGRKYNQNELGLFVHKVLQATENSNAKVYFKDSITRLIPNIKNKCVVNRDYNLFQS